MRIIKLIKVLFNPLNRVIQGRILPVFLSCCLLTSISTLAQTQSLNGEWRFNIDPQKAGRQLGWYLPGAEFLKWDKVVVPHCFSDDPRYLNFTGNTWYSRNFFVQKQDKNNRSFLHFGAVFYKAAIYINGQYVGTHEGGYTPFEFEVTPYLKPDKENTLVVEVDNSWDTKTLPGSKPLPEPGKGLNYVSSYPWMNYGGVIRDVTLRTKPDVYIKNIKIESDVDLKNSSALVNVLITVHGDSAAFVPSSLRSVISYEGRSLNLLNKSVSAKILGLKKMQVKISGKINVKDLHLWSVDEPSMYKTLIGYKKDTLSSEFGIRKVEIKGNQLFLNGSLIRFAGANRVPDIPGEGSKDPRPLLIKDLKLMKEGNMIFSRISHYAVSEDLIDWADHNGMLIIGEAANWQLTEKQLVDTAIRRKFCNQMQEMVERDWNHPSIIAWSVGNEFPADKPEGIDWTKSMKQFTNNMDPTRLVTFSSFTVFKETVKTRKEEASDYVDFISVNIYSDFDQKLRKIHMLYPDKAVFISEFGVRFHAGNEQSRLDKFSKVLEVIRPKDYIIGASLWTFNDYKSTYPGTDPDGYRAWGIVTPQREKRGLYRYLQTNFSAVVIEEIASQKDCIKLRVTSRPDFPRAELSGYKIRYDSKEFKLKILKPGEYQEVEFTRSKKDSVNIVTVLSPLNFEVAAHQLISK